MENCCFSIQSNSYTIELRNIVKLLTYLQHFTFYVFKSRATTFQHKLSRARATKQNTTFLTPDFKIYNFSPLRLWRSVRIEYLFLNSLLKLTLSMETTNFFYQAELPMIHILLKQNRINTVSNHFSFATLVHKCLGQRPDLQCT